MKKILFSIAALAVAFSFTACSNEDEALESGNKGTITVTAFTESNATRSALADDGKGAYDVVWSEFDNFYNCNQPEDYYSINRTDAGSTTAKFKGPAVPANSRFVFIHDGTGEDYPSWITFQTYKANNVSVFPMRAVGTSDAEGNLRPLQFKNLGGVLRLNIKGTAKIKDITVSANELMSGGLDGEYGNPEVDSYTAKISDWTGTDYINLNCMPGVELNNTDGVDFYFAIPANTYTGVTIKLTDTNGNSCTKTFKGTGLVIERSKMTKASFTVGKFVPEDALPGRFSVSDTKTVHFSKGNLYYDSDASKFKMYESQYIVQITATNLANFFWSATATDACASSCSNEKAGEGDVIFTNETETTPNPSFTVNGQTGVWRTLSHSEWNYLFSHYKYKYTKVCDKSGLVIAPAGATAIADSYDAAAWATAEANGYVFLPNTGYRSGTSVSETDKSCIYWSSSLCTEEGDNKNKPYRQFFQWNGTSLSEAFEDASLCYWGVGIRLVQDVRQSLQ